MVSGTNDNAEYNLLLYQLVLDLYTGIGSVLEVNAIDALIGRRACAAWELFLCEWHSEWHSATTSVELGTVVPLV